MVDLTKRLMTLQRILPVESWLADTEGANKNFENLLDRNVPEDRSVYLSQLQRIPDFHSALQVIRKELQENSLYLLKDGVLIGVYQELKQQKKVEVNFIELYPEIMVIANIIAVTPLNLMVGMRGFEPWTFTGQGCSSVLTPFYPFITFHRIILDSGKSQCRKNLKAWTRRE